MLWEPETPWEGQDAYIIGGGASLRGFDFDTLKGLNTLGCNDAFRLGEEVCKVCIFGDASWWHRVKWDLEKYKGTVFTCAPSLSRLNLNCLTHVTRERKGLHKGATIGWNHSTGAAAINLAANMGAKRIFLLGFDLRLEKGKSHWHDRRPQPTKEAIFARFIKGFQQIADTAAGFNVEIKHVIDGHSALPFFQQVPFRELNDILQKAIA